MRLQLIQDGFGKNTGVFVPINDWNILVQKYEDLRDLVNTETITKIKLSELEGKLPKVEGEKKLQQLLQSRNEWEERNS